MTTTSIQQIDTLIKDIEIHTEYLGNFEKQTLAQTILRNVATELNKLKTLVAQDIAGAKSIPTPAPYIPPVDVSPPKSDPRPVTYPAFPPFPARDWDPFTPNTPGIAKPKVFPSSPYNPDPFRWPSTYPSTNPPYEWTPTYTTTSGVELLNKVK